jgi:UDP:flavonoid glycosyltransferase YjiC (YdhE family)
MHRWLHSPQLVIGFFPAWFAAPQSDWPENTHLVGFPLWDGISREMPIEVEKFLSGGDPPVIFTPGSAGATMHKYFLASVEAARELGVRAMLVTNFLEQTPRLLPPAIRAFSYVQFSKVLPHAALLVYHGGIGTLAQTIKAGIPHLVVPNGHDQFDNGWRIEQLALGRSIPQTRYHARPVAKTIGALLADETLRARCREYAARIDSVGAVTRACELIEDMARRSGLVKDA